MEKREGEQTEEQRFFDAIAPRWDSMRKENPARLRAILARIPMRKGASVLDVGSGTGVLVPYLAEAIGAQGSILAVDSSRNMLAEAERKFHDLPGVSFRVADVVEDPLPEHAFDVITCLNVYPHFVGRKQAFCTRMRPLLRDGGWLAVLHDIPRAEVNSIHQTEAETKSHLLPPAEKTGELLEQCGYASVTAYEDETCYIVCGRRV